ncbi:MAG: SLC13 family permease [Coriobacteriia bacterium]|nr:SLC13 family permease [Coriobacteriia bacterium]MCL2750493.1 SLC13 family permease [Coriobacteriia bacterium]
MIKNSYSYIGSGLFLLLALAVMILKPFSPDLGDQGQMVIGGVLITIGIWIFKPFDLPLSAGAMFLAFFLLFQGLAPHVVLSGFAGSALWTLIPALYFGYILQKTGLGRRIALGIIKVFKPTYPFLIIAWLIIGIGLSAMTPSMTVRVAILIPIALQLNELFKLEKGSKGNSLMLLTALAVAIIPGQGWLTGSLSGPIIQGMFDSTPELAGLITFDIWLSVNLLPMLAVTVLLLVGGYFALKPADRLSVATISELKQQKTEKISRDEIATVVILALVFVLFLTESFHGIPTAGVCLIALVFFFVFRVIVTSDINAGINWDLVIFLGVALSMGAVVSAVDIAPWLAKIVVPALSPIAANPWLFVLLVATVLFLWRFVDTALLIPTMAIIIPILPAISEAYSISPLVWIPMFCMAAPAMFLSYQNMWVLMTNTMAGERALPARHLFVFGAVYFLACLIVLGLATPAYLEMGLL